MLFSSLEKLIIPEGLYAIFDYVGKPSEASIEKGQELFSWMVSDLSDVINKGVKEQPPLPYSYHSPITSDK